MISFFLAAARKPPRNKGDKNGRYTDSDTCPRATLLDVEPELEPELDDDVVEVKLLVSLAVIEGKQGEFNDVAEDVESED